MNSIVFSRGIKAEGGFIVFRAFICEDGQMTGQKVVIEEKSIMDIWQEDEPPLATGTKYIRIIHNILRNKIQNKEYLVMSDGSLHVSI